MEQETNNKKAKLNIFQRIYLYFAKEQQYVTENPPPFFHGAGMRDYMADKNPKLWRTDKKVYGIIAAVFVGLILFCLLGLLITYIFNLSL